MRGWIIVVTMNEEGDYVSMERFMPDHRFSNPMDMEFGPNGDLYVLEYGSGWFRANDDARLVRIEYNAGNRNPQAQLASDKSAGTTPLNVALSSAGTSDPDGDALDYAWMITDKAGQEVARHSGTSLEYTFDQPGEYIAALTVTDEDGARSTAETRIVAGNDPPQVEIDLMGCNRSFFFDGVPINYTVRVNDQEDGSLDNGGINAAQVALTADYLAEGFDMVEIAQGHRAADAAVAHAAGRELVEDGTCLSCHLVAEASVGPSYKAVAEKYEDDPDAVEYLSTKIREGGSGVWGEVVMPPHSQLTEDEVQQMAGYILSLGDEESAPMLPVEGTYMPPEGSTEGVVVLRAAYTDRGANGLPGAMTEETLILRSSTVVVSTSELSDGTMKISVPQMPTEITIAMAPNSHARMADVDLTNISAINFVAMVPPQLEGRGGYIEVRQDAADGPVIGKTEMIESAMPGIFRAELEASTGVYDLYFVFKNDEPGEGGLFVVTTAEFISSDVEMPANHEGH